MSQLLQMVQRRRKPLLVETRVCPHCGRREDAPVAGVTSVTLDTTLPAEQKTILVDEVFGETPGTTGQRPVPPAKA
jgi:hypothetical protein